ncbi:MAG: hypothetical protein LBI54_08305 [Lachnospiraceae bacterium]|jgi:hypothetical protein|nr:hypothetical protein [Lachnospiraceae bacterium]
MKTQNKLIIILSTLALLFTACAGPNRIEGEVESMSQAEENTGVVDSGETQANAGEAAAPAPANKGYTFKSKGVVISVDANFAPLLAELGEPNNYFEAPSCAFEGLDKIYTYNGFTVNTYPQGDDDFVSSIILNDDSVTTAEGVYIGGTREDMENAYGPGQATESGQFIYEKEGMKLGFITDDSDVIIAIEYMSKVLDELG